MNGVGEDGRGRMKEGRQTVRRACHIRRVLSRARAGHLIIILSLTTLRGAKRRFADRVVCAEQGWNLHRRHRQPGGLDRRSVGVNAITVRLLTSCMVLAGIWRVASCATTALFIAARSFYNVAFTWSQTFLWYAILPEAAYVFILLHLYFSGCL